MWKKIKRCVLLWWYRLWIRKGELHHSLYLNSLDLNLESLSKEEKEEYLIDLNRRREIAHRKDLTKC